MKYAVMVGIVIGVGWSTYPLYAADNSHQPEVERKIEHALQSPALTKQDISGLRSFLFQLPPQQDAPLAISRLVIAYVFGDEKYTYFTALQTSTENGKIYLDKTGNILALPSSDTTIHLWQEKTCDKIGILKNVPQRIGMMQFSHDAKMLALEDQEKTTIELWNVQQLTRTAILPKHTDEEVWSLQFSPNSTLLAVAYYSVLVLWDIPKKKIIHRKHDKGRCSSKTICFSPNSQLLAIGWALGNISLKDLTPTNQKINTLLRSGGKHASALCFSPNGNLFAAGNEYGEVVLWHMPTLAYLITIYPNRRKTLPTMVTSLNFSRDGTLLAIGLSSSKPDSQGLVKIVNVRNVPEIHPVQEVHPQRPCPWPLAYFRSSWLIITSKDHTHIEKWWDPQNEHKKTYASYTKP